MAALWSVPLCKDIFAPPQWLALHLSQFSSEQREKTVKRKSKTIYCDWQLEFHRWAFLCLPAIVVLSVLILFLISNWRWSHRPWPQPHKWRMELKKIVKWLFILPSWPDNVLLTSSMWFFLNCLKFIVSSAALPSSVPRSTATLMPSRLQHEVCSHLQLRSKRQSYWSLSFCNDRRQVGRDDSPTPRAEGKNVYSCVFLFSHSMQLWVRLIRFKCNCRLRRRNTHTVSSYTKWWIC